MSGNGGPRFVAMYQISLFEFVFVGWLLVAVHGCVCLWVALVTDLYKMAAMHDNEDLADFEENAEIAMSTAQQAVLLGTRGEGN